MVVLEAILEPGPLVCQLADAFTREWPEWAATLSREALEATFVSEPDGALPLVLVAHSGGRALGTIALRPWFAEAPMPQTPWVRGLYVDRGQRGSGIDRLLYEAVEREARDRGFRTLYAATTAIERLLARRGWRVFHRLEHEGAPMAWMRLPLYSDDG